MSLNDPAPEQPAEPQPLGPTPADGAISGPSMDYQTPPTAPAERPPMPPGWQPELGLPSRTIVQKPRPPHPNFWWSWLWCFFFLFTTQLPGAVVAGGLMVAALLLWPDQFPKEQITDQASLMKSPQLSLFLAIAFFITELLVIGVSLVVIRLVAGRDWTRQLAVRRPSAAHTVLAVASLPALLILGNVAYDLLRNALHVPSISDAGLLELALFWFAFLLVLGGMLLMIRLIAGRGWAGRFASRPPRLQESALTLAGVALLMLLTGFLYQGLYRVLNLQAGTGPKLGGMEEMVRVFSQWPWPFAVLVIGMGPGIGEELWCRGFLGRGLVGTHGVLLGVLASSFFFGFIHLDPCQGTMAMLMGLWLHFVYLTTRSLWLPMLLHFLNNSVAVVSPRFPELAILDAKPSDIPTIVYVAGGLLLAAVAYGLYQCRARLEAEGPEAILNWRPPYDGVEYPPPHSGTRVVHPPLSMPVLTLTGVSFCLFVLACLAWIRVT
jgi:membrane protease YdiL (CAAX protease family)